MTKANSTEPREITQDASGQLDVPERPISAVRVFDALKCSEFGDAIIGNMD